MAADLREMQENQGFSENLIDKLEFVDFTVQEIATIISLSPVLRQEYTL